MNMTQVQGVDVATLLHTFIGLAAGMPAKPPSSA
jgi:hypothetical protein